MGSADWTFLKDGLDIATVDRGVTAGIARPPGGGSFVYAFNSLAAVQGAVGLFANLVDFAPMAKGGSIRGCRQLDRLYRNEFSHALRIAVEALSDRDWLLLRQHAIDGVRIDQLAKFHGMHYGAAARCIQTARETVLALARRELTRNLSRDMRRLVCWWFRPQQEGKRAAQFLGELSRLTEARLFVAREPCSHSAGVHVDGISDLVDREA